MADAHCYLYVLADVMLLEQLVSFTKSSTNFPTVQQESLCNCVNQKRLPKVVRRSCSFVTHQIGAQALHGLHNLCLLSTALTWQDPVQDKFPEESMQGALRRNRIGGQNTARPASRSSQAGARGRGHQASHAYDPFNNHSPSQVSLFAD